MVATTTDAPALFLPPGPTHNVRPGEDLQVAAIVGPGGFECSGVLVAPRHVLTARHCLPARFVLFGNDVRRPSRSEKVVAVAVPDDAALDAALLTLEAAVPYRPALLPPAGRLRAPVGTVRIFGFGASEPSGHGGEGHKRRADLIVNGWGCPERRQQQTGCSPETDLVIPRIGNLDTCNGDSGGPVYELVAGDQLRLLAITSRAMISAARPCLAGGIYLRVDVIADWIRRSIASTKGETP